MYTAGIPLYVRHEMVGMVGISNRPEGYDDDVISFLGPLLQTGASIMFSVMEEERRKAVELKVRQLNAQLETRVQERTAEVSNKERWGYLQLLSHSLILIDV